MMLLLTVALLFASLIALSMPIVFALAVAGIAGLWLGGYPLQQLSRHAGGPDAGHFRFSDDLLLRSTH